MRIRRSFSPPTCKGWKPMMVGVGLGVGIGAAAAAVVGVLKRQLTPPQETPPQPLDTPYAVNDAQFIRSLSSVLPPPVQEGNRVETLLNGDQIFPAMLEAIRNAQQTITMETYIYWSGRPAEAVSEALADRARAGVSCHLVLDWFGSQRMDARLLGRMRDAGVEVCRFHAPRWTMQRVNHRTHRKLLVIDGRVGFTGGVGIAEEWTGHAQDPCHWRDNHYRIEGPVVGQLQSAFSDNWLKSQHTVLHDSRYFPELPPVGGLRCQAFHSSPEEGSKSMQLMVLLGLSAARKSIDIATAYFVPDELTIQTLQQAAARGVNIRVIVPGPHIDKAIVHHASRDRWKPLIQAGVHIHEYQPTMYHTKTIMVDGFWTSIGSANFDNRSFRLNDETNLNVFDHAFAQEQAAWFEDDLCRAREVTLDDLESRSSLQTVADRTASAMGSQF